MPTSNVIILTRIRQNEAFDKYKVVKEYKDRRTEEVCIAEFNILM